MESRAQFTWALDVSSEEKHYMATNPPRDLSVLRWQAVTAAHALATEKNSQSILSMVPMGKLQICKVFKLFPFYQHIQYLHSNILPSLLVISSITKLEPFFTSWLGVDDDKELLKSQINFEKFGQSAIFTTSTLMDQGGVPPSSSPASLLKEAIHVISCGYEDKTEWGTEVMLISRKVKSLSLSSIEAPI